MLVSAEATLAQAQAAVAGTTLVAPIGGTVGTVPWQVGDTASPGAGIQIVGSGAAKVTVQVSEAQLSTISVGQVAHVTISGVPTVDGSVSAIALLPTSSSSSSTGGTAGTAGGGASTSTTPTYAVDILVPTMSDLVGTGGKATVAVVVAHATNVLIAPVSAVTNTGSGSGTVQVNVNGVATQRVVKLGASGGGRVQLVSGVSAGDRLIIADASAPLPTNGTIPGQGTGGIPGLGGTNVRVPGAGGGTFGGGGAPGGAGGAPPPGR